MTKEILIQYSDLQEEVKDLRKRIDRVDQELSKIKSEGEVIDCVKGGDGGIQNFKITGFPMAEYSRKKTKSYMYKAQLESAEFELMEMLNDVEEYIQSISDSRMRRLLRHYIIDDDGWTVVALHMGGKTTPDSARMEFNRFMESK